VTVSETSKQFAREFLNSSANDDSRIKELNGAKKTFNIIASMLIQRTAGDDGIIISKAVIDEIAELSGTTDRRVYTVLEALEAEGWRPNTGCAGRNDQL